MVANWMLAKKLSGGVEFSLLSGGSPRPFLARSFPVSGQIQSGDTQFFDRYLNVIQFQEVFFHMDIEKMKIQAHHQNHCLTTFSNIVSSFQADDSVSTEAGLSNCEN
jgi:hypothetical protein